LLGNQFDVSDASSVQQICKQKLTCEINKKTKARFRERNCRSASATEDADYTNKHTLAHALH